MRALRRGLSNPTVRRYLYVGALVGGLGCDFYMARVYRKYAIDGAGGLVAASPTHEATTVLLPSTTGAAGSPSSALSGGKDESAVRTDALIGGGSAPSGASTTADAFRRYRIDASGVSKPGAFIHAKPRTGEQHMTMFYPRNGTVVWARPVPGQPDWLELVNGQYIRHSLCGVVIAFDDVKRPKESAAEPVANVAKSKQFL